MKLADKGPIKPPPLLKGPARFVSHEIQSWPGIVAATHWFLYDQTQVDGVDFYVGDRELGYIHLDGEIHLGTARTLGARLIEHGLADPTLGFNIPFTKRRTWTRKFCLNVPRSCWRTVDQRRVPCLLRLPLQRFGRPVLIPIRLHLGTERSARR